MLETLFAPHNLVFWAGAIFTIAYLIINQVAMRLFLLAGTVFYISYYATIAEAPLWEAIYTSIVMATANLIGLGLLTARKSKWSVPAKHRDIYPLFTDLLPGDFRQLVALAQRHTLQEPRELAREGEPVETLYFVISGTLTVTKLDNQFRMPPEVFVGEVAYLTQQSAAATTSLPAGSEVLEWDVAKLRKHAAKKARFKMALEAIISRDLAQKVTVAVAPTVCEDLMAARPLKRGRIH